MKILILFLLFLLIADKVSSSLLLWISLDGFRQDYISKEVTPNMYELFMNRGRISKEHKAFFTTKTFPNHFSQVTGLTEEHHGIINNSMYDKELGNFNMATTDIEWWDPNGTNVPIWTINQENGGSSAIVYWVSSPVPFKGILPDFYFEGYNKSCNVTCRVDFTIEQFKLNKRNLVMMYIEEVDTIGHEYGPDSVERIATTTMVDNELGRLFKELEKMGIINEINIMISSDHGMTPILSNNHIDITNLLDEFEYRIISTGTVYQIDCELETAIKIQKILSAVSNIHAVYLKDEIPDDYNYKNSDHVPILTAIPDDKYIIMDKSHYSLLGDHGYPNDVSENMIAFFAVAGPSINMDNELEMTDQADLFKIACELLELSKYCNDSDGKLPEGLIRKKNNSRTIALVICLPIIIVILIIALVLGAYYGLRSKRTNSSA